MRKAIATKSAPQAIGPYSQAAEALGLVFVSGQIALGADGAMAAQDVPGQTKQALKNLKAILEAAGLGLKDVVKCTVYMTDLSQFPAMNEVYAKFFEVPYPARAAAGVSALPKGALVEVEAIAARE